MLDFNNFMLNRNVNRDEEERRENMKDYIDYNLTMDSTKKEHPNIEPKTVSNKEENQNNDSNRSQSQSNIHSIEPNFNYINPNSTQENTPTKGSKNPKISNKPKNDEKIGTNNSSDFQKFFKLRPHFFRMQQILEPFNIKIIESDSINLKQAKEKIGIGIKKLKQMTKNEKSLSEALIIFENFHYLNERKKDIEDIIKNESQIIYFVKEENILNLNFEQNQKNDIVNNISNCSNNEMKLSITPNQGVTKENDKIFLNKKRYLKIEQLNNNDADNNINNNYEINNNIINNYDTDNNIIYKNYTDNNIIYNNYTDNDIIYNNYTDNNIINNNDSKNNIINNLKETEPSSPKNNKGRLSNDLKKKGIKGKKDGSHPANAAIKIIRHSLENICIILQIIVNIFDIKFKIHSPGINDKDIVNTTKKEETLEKTIEVILCVYVSIESKKNIIEENRKNFNELLGKDIPGKEKEQNLIKQILQMTLKDVCNNFINNIKNFIDGFTFNTFEDDEDFQRYDISQRELILNHFKEIMEGKIIKRPNAHKNN